MDTPVNQRVLIIDDDRDIWKAYQLVLSSIEEADNSPMREMGALLEAENNSRGMDYCHFNLSFAAQGKDGFDKVARGLQAGKPFALAFIDVRMPPGWDGMETAARIRRIDPDIEIVIVTAFSDRSCAEISRAVGSSDKLLYFRKPFDPEELKQLAISLSAKYHLAGEQEAQRHELHTILSTSPAAMFTLDASRKILSWNPAAELITGYTPMEVIGKPCILQKISNNPGCVTCSNHCDLVNLMTDHQLSIVDKEGNAKILSMNIANIPTSREMSAKIVGSFWDITALKTTEAELSRTNEMLKDQIVERDRLKTEHLKLEKQLHQAQKMEAIGMMAGGVAHDLNNILSGVISYPELLLLKLPPGDELREPIKAIRESGLRAAAVVTDLLTVARGVATVREVAGLNTLIREYLESPEAMHLKSFYPEVKISTKLEANLFNIECSPIHIKKCLMNLLTNAAEAIAGAGMITIATCNQKLNYLAGLEGINIIPGHYVVLTVSDNGPGIPIEDQERIFEPFYTKKKMGRSGTGLGLAVVWNTIQDHNGAIKVTSSENGTVFTLYFPAVKTSVDEKKSPVAFNDLTGSGTILVVDDEPQQRDIAILMLSKLGYSVEAVASGEEAVEYLREQPVDLLFLDMLMEPGINGYQTYKQIIKFRPEQKAVIASGFSENEDVKKARKIGASSFILKPYSLEQLGVVVRNEMRQT